MLFGGWSVWLFVAKFYHLKVPQSISSDTVTGKVKSIKCASSL